jgi:DNA-binding SARP family transcriptional activator
MAELCALALDRGIEREFAREVVAARGLAPGPRARTVAAWPWPIRIEALGGLEVVREGVRAETGKRQRKPLELLALLVARGPRGAGVAAIAEALWPDTEGDTAHHTLETTAYRLRRLLGDPAALVHRAARLALDPGRVFVDAWAFEALAARAEVSRAARDALPASRSATSALALYRGELLGDLDLPFAVAPRRHLAALRARIEALQA